MSVVVGLGSNLGAREAAILAARDLLDARPGIDVVRQSPIYETAPLGPPQGSYLNAAFRIETSSSLPELLSELLRIERRLGRVRSTSERWGPRSIDLDLLWDSRGSHHSAGLVVPHAELERRDFALAPALDVAPDLGDHYEVTLRRLGGRPPVWERHAIVHTERDGDGLETIVEADSVSEACALATGFHRPDDRPWSTVHAKVEASPDHFLEVVRRVLRTGFAIHRTTLSHCSKTQWIAQFHGVNTGMQTQPDVRLRTTSGSERAFRAQLSTRLPAI